MEKKRLRIVLTLLTVTLVLAGSAVAIWQFNWSGVTGMSVRSDSPLKFISDFAWDEVNTTSNGFEKSDSVQIINRDGEIFKRVVASFEVVDTNLSDGCSPSGDFNYTITHSDWGGGVISNGTIISFTSSNSYLTANLTAKNYSCPANVSLEVELQEP